MNRAHRMNAEGFSGDCSGLDMPKIQRAVRRALDLMDGNFDVRLLAQNDPDHDWEFKPVDQLHDKHGVFGFYWREGVLVDIFWDADLPTSEIMLTIAHELGHHFLHSLQGKLKPDSQDEHDLMEREAEGFAQELLAG